MYGVGSVFGTVAALLFCGCAMLHGAERGMAAYQSHDHRAAAPELENAVREQPNNAECQKMFGESYVAQGGHWHAIL